MAPAPPDTPSTSPASKRSHNSSAVMYLWVATASPLGRRKITLTEQDDAIEEQLVLEIGPRSHGRELSDEIDSGRKSLSLSSAGTRATSKNVCPKICGCPGGTAWCHTFSALAALGVTIGSRLSSIRLGAEKERCKCRAMPKLTARARWHCKL